MKKLALVLIALTISFIGFSQEEEEATRSNVQEFTPSKLLKKGQWDIKFFNSLYTQTEQTDSRSKSLEIARQNFFTNTTEVYTGVSNNSRINVGLIFQVRSNTLGGQSISDVFKFEDNGNDLRSGLTTIAPSIRIQPFKNISNFSLTSSFYIPVFKDQADTVPTDNVFSYLDLRSYAWETKFFYDKTFGGNNWQLFTEVDFKYNFGDDEAEAGENSSERFANNSLNLPISIFLSYFPSSKSTIFVNTQQAFLIDLGNDFAQNSTAFGFGGKYQLTDVLNIEASLSKIVRGNNFQGLGQTFSIGLRALL
ncbi:hypothetical protein [uncultured Lacinutrix sp.]|uniref:hypothetical protein n=1 Tax=uncultured Lacinutrix sp. TaxID=574032 RepID=UPI002636588F|nr:hypothetical protein [uncultured Lacinutrix sp.]